MVDRTKERFLDRLHDLETSAKIFVVLVCLEALTSISLTIYKIVTLAPVTDLNRDLIVLAIVFLVIQLFLVYFAVNAVLIENAFELFAFLMASLLIVAYGVSLFFTTADKTALVWIEFIAVATLGPVSIVVAGFVYMDFGWYLFNKIGADVQMIELFRMYQIFISALKTDFMMGIIAVSLASAYLLGSREMILDIVALVVTLGWAILGSVAARKEHVYGFYVYFAFATVEPAYIGYKFGEYFMDPARFDDVKNYLSLLIVVGVVAICVRVFLVIVSVIVFWGMGKGLRVVLAREEEEEPLQDENSPFAFLNEPPKERRNYGGADV